MKHRIFLVVTLIGFVLRIHGQSLHYPSTEKITHTDSYFGVRVADPYRWLENDTSRIVADWVDAQNKVTFGYLEKIPYRQKVKERLTKIWNYPKYSAPFREGKNFFFFKNDGIQNQSVMYIQTGLDAKPDVFLDPNKFSQDGTIALSGFAFSKDGKYFGYGISRSGSDWREMYIMDVESRKKISDELKWVKFSGISWLGNGFFYNRYDAPLDTSKMYSMKNDYQKVFFHEVGTNQSNDTLIYQDNDNPLRTFGINATEDERFLSLSISQGGSKGNALYYRDNLSGKSTFLPIHESFEDRIYVIDNAGDKLILYTNRNAPNGRVIKIDPKNAEEKYWQDVIPEKTEVLQSATTTGGKMFVTYIKDVSHRVYVFDMNGTLENEVVLPTLGTVGGFGGKKNDTFVFYTFTSFTFPSTIYRYDIPTKQSALYRESEVDFKADDYETKQVFYRSKDGTQVPMFIVHKKGTMMNGMNPAWLSAYGGFNISIMPSFNIARLVWLEQGGIAAVANLRGGGEYGEGWHEAGMKTNKQNVFDDFCAAAEYLIAQKYTSAEKLVVQGGSNGGLLIGTVMNQRPELFRVGLPAVGVMDMLRYHKYTIGWSWVREYGSSDDSIDFKYLYLYSPLHNIREGIKYPATLVTTADHDDRVVPAHSFKYIATLQEKYRGDNPVLIRIETKAGHGGGKPTTKIIEENADIYAFVFHNLGMTPKY